MVRACLLGHKSPIMTQPYAHHYPESLREGVEILERYTLPSIESTNLAHTAGVNPSVETVWNKHTWWF